MVRQLRYALKTQNSMMKGSIVKIRLLSLLALFVVLISPVTALSQDSPCHVFAPDGRPIPVGFRKIDLEEGKLLFCSDESDEAVENMRAYWNSYPGAYYRWDPDSAEMGLITDIAKMIYHLDFMDIKVPNAYPTAVAGFVDGKERILAVGTFTGDAHFHSDSELRRRGFRGLGTALIVAYLRFCRDTGYQAAIFSVNNSYGFYEKVGFKFASDEHTPDKVANPAQERFSMYISSEDIPAVLAKLAERDKLKVQHYELHRQ